MFSGDFVVDDDQNVQIGVQKHIDRVESSPHDGMTVEIEGRAEDDWYAAYLVGFKDDVMKNNFILLTVSEFQWHVGPPLPTTVLVAVEV